MNMQLDDLQKQWQQLNRKVDQVMTLEAELLRHTLAKSAQSRVRWLGVWPGLDAICYLSVVLASGAFLGDHWGTWSLVVPAGLILVLGNVLMVDSIVRLCRLAVVDWSGPVTAIQSALAAFRADRVRHLKWLLLWAPLLGFCCLLIGVQAMMDRAGSERLIYEYVSHYWIVANVIFGVAFLMFGNRLAAWLQGRFSHHGWFQRLLDDISGVSTLAAEREVDTWAQLLDQPSE